MEACGVTSVAMESTGVYWIPLYQILMDSRIEVCLVNARHFHNVPGRKTDVLDCQWLQYLHSVGLPRGSFWPQQVVCAVRTLLRHRHNLVQLGAKHTLHMQKAMEQMNVKPEGKLKCQLSWVVSVSRRPVARRVRPDRQMVWDQF